MTTSTTRTTDEPLSNNPRAATDTAERERKDAALLKADLAVDRLAAQADVGDRLDIKG